MNSGSFSSLATSTGEKQHNHKNIAVIAIIILVVAAFGFAAFYLTKNNDDQELAEQSQRRILPASWLIRYFGTDNENDPSVKGPLGDPDGDVLTNYQEFYFGTDPTNEDTDGDGQFDGAEVAFNQNPLGEGELYNTDYSSKVAGKFLSDNDLEEYTPESIERRINELLQVPDIEDVQIQLTDSSALVIGTDTSAEAVNQYFEEVEALSEQYQISTRDLVSVLEKNTYSDLFALVDNIYAFIDKMRGVEVPVPLVNIHQLKIAGLFSAANLLENALEVDEYQALEEQQELYQQQFYQITSIEKTNQLILADYERLKERYPAILEKFITE